MLSDAELDRCLEEAVACAKLAGAIVSECVLKTRQEKGKNTLNDTAQEKGSITDLATEYDRKCEDLIMARLRERFPSYDLLGEETFKGQRLTDKPTWVIDPIDGTLSFMHGSFDCCICVGLAVNKQSVLGVIYAPLLDELYTAVKGRGAFCNGERMHVAPTTKLNKALISTHFPSYTRSGAFVDNLMKIWRGLMQHPVQGMRAFGSAGLDLCSVARGRLDCYFEVGIWAWDVCAGAILVTEAGGVMLDITGGRFDLENRRLLACATPELAQDIRRYLDLLDMDAAKL